MQDEILNRMRCPRERNPLMGRASGRRTFHPRFVLIERECETRNFFVRLRPKRLHSIRSERASEERERAGEWRD